MSNKRITDLTELTTPTTDDVFPVVDIATNTTTKVQLGNLPIPTSVTTALATKQDTLVSGTNIKTINSTSLLGSGNITIAANPSGVAGAIQFSDGSAFASDAANLFWDNTNKRLGVGTSTPSSTFHLVGAARFQSLILGAASAAAISNTSQDVAINITNQGVGIGSFTTFSPTARLQVRGSGSTSATTALLVQNSSGTASFTVNDAGAATVTSTLTCNSTIDVQGLVIGTGQRRLYSSSSSNANLVINTSGILASTSGFVASHASAVLEAVSTTQGFLPPRMTTTQKNAIATPASGLVVYDTTTNTTDTYDGTTWQRFGQQTLIKGSGSTSATTSLLVQNSSGTDAVTIRDDLRVIVPQIFETGGANGFIFNSNTITPKINGSLVLDRNSNREFRIIDGTFTRDYLILQTSSSSNFANISFNTSHLAIKKEGNIGIGTSTPNASSILEVTSTTQGVLFPRMTTTQKNAIATPAAGLVVYDSTTNKLCCYNGSTWNDLF